jgi:hypothetical protein
MKIDFGIRSFVKDLNRCGFETLFSCAGHSDVVTSRGKIRADVDGYVVVRGNQDHLSLAKIAKKYVKVITIKKSRMMDLTGEQKTFVATRISFEPKNLSKWNGG